MNTSSPNLAAGITSALETGLPELLLMAPLTHSLPELTVVAPV